MSFSTLDGLMLGTRCGTIDPGVILYLPDHRLSAADVQRLLYQQSGLLGSRESPAICANCWPALTRGQRRRWTCSFIGSDASWGGWPPSTASTPSSSPACIGENAAAIRARVCRDAAWLGLELELDADANVSGGPCIRTASSRVPAWVIPTNEEALIARHTCRLAFAASTGALAAVRHLRLSRC